jgi:hypothetical protein
MTNKKGRKPKYGVVMDGKIDRRVPKKDVKPINQNIDKYLKDKYGKK